MAVLSTLANSPIEIDTGSTPEDRKVRARVAAALMLGGTSYEPVQHWTQGLARVAQGLAGGYELGELNREAKESQAGDAKLIANLPGVRAAPAAEYGPTGPPNAVPPSPAVVRPPLGTVPPSGGRVAAALSGSPAARVAGAFETTQGAINSGVIDPQGTSNNLGAPPAGPQMAQTPQSPMPSPQQPTVVPRTTGPLPGGPPQGLGPQRQTVDIPPDVAASIRELASKGKTKEAMVLYGQYAKPREEARPLVTPQERAAYGIQPEDKRPYQVTSSNELKHPPAETKVNVNSVADPIIHGIGQRFDQTSTSAFAAARSVIPSIHDARRALDEGATTGAFSQPRVFVQKVADLFGIPAEQASNTEVFKGAIGNAVLADIKKLGANPSNTDLRFIQEVKGSSAELEEKTIRKLLDIQEKYARQAIKNYNEDAKKLVAANPEAYRGVAGAMTLDEPPQYEAPPSKPKPANLRQQYGLE